MSQFIMLMRREWMQHRTGWLVVMLAPMVVLLIGSFFDGGVTVDVDGDIKLPPLHLAPPLIQTALLVAAVTAITLFLALLTLGFQLPGLAWRDQQDRSIEFWTSLPVSHSKAIAATLVTQILVLPAAAIAVGMVGGFVAGTVTVVTSSGVWAWLTQPWGLLLLSALALLVRLSVGLLLAAAWLSPLLMLTLVASAWLRRWGVPVVAALLAAGTLLLDKRLSEPLVAPVLQRLGVEALRSLLWVDGISGLRLKNADDALDFLHTLPAILLRDLLPLLRDAASPAMLLALLVAAGGFGLLVVRRQRGA